jgi:hypothetical protein
MIDCPVCGTRNHHLNVVCSSCGGFVQGRVDNLDLFSTIWNLIERPRRAFHQIAIARYKNYSTIVPGLAGAGFVFAFFWFINAGDHTSSTMSLLLGGMAAGPPVGVVLTLLMSGLLWTALRVSGVTVRFRNLYAVLAYCTVPVLLAAVFILPLEVFTFGRYFFSLNPPPWLLKPISYYTFIGLGCAVAAWTYALGVTGMKVLLDIRWMVSVALVTVPAALLLAMAWIARAVLTAPAA